ISPHTQPTVSYLYALSLHDALPISCASVASINALAAPIKAIIHIQNTAPGPPNTIAVATPAILPVPTREPALIANAWNGEIPFFPFSNVSGFSPIARNISGIHLNCTNLDPIVKNIPAVINSPIKYCDQIKSFPT